MSDSKRSDNDPSMDDILASIRKIISDDEARASVGGGPSAAPAPVQPLSPAADAPRVVRGASAGREDVLLLTDLIADPEPPAVAPAPEPQRPAPAPMPRIDPVKAAEMPQPAIEPAPEMPMTPSDPSIIAGSTAGATTSAFERLNQAMKQSTPPTASVEPGPTMGAGGKTIEDMVREMLRPMLKEWIDKNLPPMVERMVEREIVRLTRR